MAGDYNMYNSSQIYTGNDPYSYNGMGAGYGKNFEMPSNPEDRKFLSAVDAKTRSIVADKYGFLIDYEWEAYTVAVHVVEGMIASLAYEIVRSSSLNEIMGSRFYDVLIAMQSMKTNVKAEKEGNINIIFDAGPKAQKIITDGLDPIPESRISPELQFTTGDQRQDQEYSQLEHQVGMALGSKAGILFPDTKKFMIFAIAYTFFECLYAEICYRLKNDDTPLEEGEERLVTVHFSDIIEFHGVLKDDNVTFYLRPGQSAKLIIKSDEKTEDTMGDY